MTLINNGFRKHIANPARGNPHAKGLAKSLQNRKIEF